jgi:branched-chain amino acid transport system permease protein
MNTFLQLCFGGLALGTSYALIALGFVVVYRASQVFNFALGELLTLGGFVMVALCDFGVPWPLALIGAMGMTGLVGAGIERLVLRPLIGRQVFVTIIVTIFVGMILRSLVLLVWGPSPVGMPTPWDPSASISLWGANVFYSALGAVIAGVVTLIGFWWMINKTRLGIGMQATSSNQETALALGIPVGRIFGSTWFIAGAVAALAGIFLSMFPRNLDSNLGFVALRAFPAVIVGGLDSIRGAVVAGLGLGLLEVLAQGYVNEHLGQFGHNFHTVFPYLVMVLFLVFKPHGLFGTKEVERV